MQVVAARQHVGLELAHEEQCLHCYNDFDHLFISFTTIMVHQTACLQVTLFGCHLTDAPCISLLVAYTSWEAET